MLFKFPNKIKSMLTTSLQMKTLHAYFSNMNFSSFPATKTQYPFHAHI